MIMTFEYARDCVVYIILSIRFSDVNQWRLDSEADLCSLILQMTEKLRGSLLISSCANETPVFQVSTLNHMPVLDCPVPIAFLASLQRFENPCATAFHYKLFWGQLASCHLEKLFLILRILIRVSDHHSPSVHVCSRFSGVHPCALIGFKKSSIIF